MRKILMIIGLIMLMSFESYAGVSHNRADKTDNILLCDYIASDDQNVVDITYTGYESESTLSHMTINSTPVVLSYTEYKSMIETKFIDKYLYTLNTSQTGNIEEGVTTKEPFNILNIYTPEYNKEVAKRFTPDKYSLQDIPIMTRLTYHEGKVATNIYKYASLDFKDKYPGKFV